MTEVSKGSKTDLTDRRYTVNVGTDAGPGLVDVTAVLVGANGKVRTDSDFVFFNNPQVLGAKLLPSGAVEVDLNDVPSDVDRVIIAGSTEAQGKTFAATPGLSVDVKGVSQSVDFDVPGLTSEKVVQLVAFYRRGNSWKLDAIGQGYDGGLYEFGTAYGIDVEPPEVQPGTPAPEVPAAAPIDMKKVKLTLTDDSPNKVAKIDLRKSKGNPNYVLTVGLEWDGRGAKYNADGSVKKYGTGDLDVYFGCRNEETDRYVVISGESGHQGSLDVWPFMHHQGDSKGPGKGNKPATEQVIVRPNENGDLLVNIYQSVDNGSGAINTFGNPRVVIRYGLAGADGLPGPDADEITIHPGNGQNSYWATVAHVDVQDGILTVDGETGYSRPGSEKMPLLDRAGNWVRDPAGGPTGRSKEQYGSGLDRYEGVCPVPTQQPDHGSSGIW